MAQITIGDLDDALLVRLKRRAWEKGIPLKESLRRLIRAGLEADDGQTDDMFAGMKPTRPDVFGEMERAGRRPIFHA